MRWIMKEYCKKIKQLRIKNGYTIKELAEKLGVSPRTYSNYEKGESKIPIKHLISICLFYNISADYILGLEEKMPTETKKEQSFDCS